MSAEIKVLIFGVGSIGRRHLSNLRMISKERSMVLAIADPVAENREAAQNLGADEIYSSLDDALRGSSVDAALVCTPNDLHLDPRGYDDYRCTSGN